MRYFPLYPSRLCTILYFRRKKQKYNINELLPLFIISQGKPTQRFKILHTKSYTKFATRLTRFISSKVLRSYYQLVCQISFLCFMRRRGGGKGNYVFPHEKSGDKNVLWETSRKSPEGPSSPRLCGWLFTPPKNASGSANHTRICKRPLKLMIMTAIEWPPATL